MKIVAYNQDIQKLINDKTEPAPWLHIAFSGSNYSIFIWDTRKVLSDGKLKDPKQITEIKKVAKPVNDNKKPLSGGSDASKSVTFSWTSDKDKNTPAYRMKQAIQPPNMFLIEQATKHKVSDIRDGWFIMNVPGKDKNETKFNETCKKLAEIIKKNGGKEVQYGGRYAPSVIQFKL